LFPVKTVSDIPITHLIGIGKSGLWHNAMRLRPQAARYSILMAAAILDQNGAEKCADLAEIVRICADVCAYVRISAGFGKKRKKLSRKRDRQASKLASTRLRKDATARQARSRYRVNNFLSTSQTFPSNLSLRWPPTVSSPR
jgi:hypothetical protein